MELLVVVIIIGILVAIAIPVYTDITNSTKRSACDSNMRMIKSAIQQYKIKYPDGTVTEISDLKNFLKIHRNVRLKKNICLITEI